MKKPLILAAACLVAALTQAAPVLSGQWQHSLTVRPAAHTTPPQLGNTIYNPRYFDGDIYATSLAGDAYRCFGRWDSVTGKYLGGAIPSVNEHRMVGLLRGTGGLNYFLGTGGVMGDTVTFVPSFTRYDLDYYASNPMTVTSIDSQVVETFDWVDDNTMISTCYVSGQRKKLYLTDVVADPFAVSRNVTWNPDGYVTTDVSTRIRNVRVGQLYSGYAYYGDAGNNSNPSFYAIELATGTSTLLGNLGTLTGGGSFGLWTVIERGGYLYVQTTDNGIQVYNMIDATTLGSLYTTYTKAELDAATGIAPTDQYYGMDLSPDGKKLLLGAAFGNAYQLQVGVPVESGQWQLRGTVRPSADNPPQLGNSTYNPRYFDGNIHATQLADSTYRCFGYYDGASRAFLGGAIPWINEHRMLGRLRGTDGLTYLLGTGGWDGADPNAPVFVPTITRYNADPWALNPVPVNAIDDQVVESFDWVDDNTMISTCYMSGQRKKLYLTDVTTEQFALTRNTTWGPDGYVTTAVNTRIRNVRVGQVYSGYAYYGDAGNNSNPGFYAIDLATGTSTLLGNLGTLTGGGSFGLWTVIERGGYLYVQTTDNGIQVYNMVNATTLGSLVTTYTKAELDAATGVGPNDQYYGLDVPADGKKLLLGAPFGNVYELEPAPRLSISRSGTDVILSWPASQTAMVVESSSDLSLGSTGFASLDPQPAVAVSGNMKLAVIPVNPAAPAYFRLRK
jgi:hypothetical protein